MDGRILFSSFFAMIVLTAPISAQSANGGQLRLVVSDTNLMVGQEVRVDVLVEQAPTIYGADIRLTFDPARLEVVDADPVTPDIQLTAGDFIDVQHAFVLQQSADNADGTIDYALALLHPAPAVQGSGRLVQITLRAKTKGPAGIALTEGLFGTQTGETIAPTLERIDVTITPNGGGVLDSVTTSIQQGMENSNVPLSLPALGLGMLCLMLGGGVVFGIRQRRKRTHRSV